MKLRPKILTFTAIALFSAFSTMSYFLISRGVDDQKQQLNSSAKAFAALATPPIGEAYKQYGESGRFRLRTAVLGFTELEPYVTNVQIFNTKAESLFSLNPNRDAVITADEATSFEPIYRVSGNGVVSTIIYPYQENFGARSYTLVYSISSESVDESTRETVLSLVYFFVIALFATLAIVYIFLDLSLIKPIRNISRKAIEISSGVYETRISLKRSDELGELSGSVQTMADTLQGNITKLEELDKTKSEFMMITSHNLRTPLTIINGYLDALRGDETIEDMREAMKHVAESARRLRSFSEDMLTISKFELGGGDAAFENCDIKSLLTNIKEDFSDLARDKNITFEAIIPPESVAVHGNRAQIRAALWNLMDNAYKFTPKGGRIVLKCSLDNSNVRIAVADSGIGIPEKEIPKLFTKFHRGTGTLTYNYEGTGIGLYLSKLIIDRHKGRIEVDTELGRGTTITVVLPVGSSDI